MNEASDDLEWANRETTALISEIKDEGSGVGAEFLRNFLNFRLWRGAAAAAATTAFEGNRAKAKQRSPTSVFWGEGTGRRKGGHVALAPGGQASSPRGGSCALDISGVREGGIRCLGGVGFAYGASPPSCFSLRGERSISRHLSSMIYMQTI